jgi:hypothetical protein
VSETEVLPQQDTRVREDTKPDLSHGDGDHERFAHYVDKSKIVDSMVTGTPVTALCGKVWVPSRDPKRYPVCPTCKEIYDMLPPGGEGDELSHGVPGHKPAQEPVTSRPREHSSSTQ